MRSRLKGVGMSRGGGEAVYGLGMIGAVVYYFQHAGSFWLVLVGIFKAIFWPAFLVHALLALLHM